MQALLICGINAKGRNKFGSVLFQMPFPMINILQCEKDTLGFLRELAMGSSNHENSSASGTVHEQQCRWGTFATSLLGGRYCELHTNNTPLPMRLKLRCEIPYSPNGSCRLWLKSVDFFRLAS